ncbi:MAG TPA: glycosyltransferase family 39 protein [Candidatus Dormibacteraeota bacterium]|nr:glycosyltransferase family 39 protein [Candidatus Dormibacteraeota bacterium]
MDHLRRLLPLVIVLATATVLRFRDLSALPPATYRDVALTATDALRAASGHPRLHYTYDEGLYSNLMAVVFLLLGPSDWTVRAPGALFGVLTCWGVFRLGRALGRGSGGLFGAGLLAVSFWHVLLSRSGFRAVLLPCLLVHSAALLVEGLRGGGRWRPALGGVLFGLGLHVYPSVRFAPLFLPAYVLSERRAAAAGSRKAVRALLLFAGTAFAVAAPMLLHYIHHPEHFTYPRRVLSVFSPKVATRDVPAYLERNLGRTLLMFHLRGDENWRHNLSGAPMLDPLTGILFLLGLVLVFRKEPAAAERGARDGGGDWTRPPAPTAALLVGWLLVMLLPNILSVEGVPHGLRSCGVLPAVALLGGIGFAGVSRRVRDRMGGRAAAAVALATFLCIGGWTAYRYFDVWGGEPLVARDHDGAFRAASRVLLAAPAGVDRLLVANGSGFPAYGHPVEAQVYLWEMRDHPPAVLGPMDAARMVLGGRPALIALIARDERIVQIIRDLNPGAPLSQVRGAGLSDDSPVYRVN